MKRVIIFVIVVSISFAQGVLQSYPKGKIFLKKGVTLEGKDLKITKDAASLNIGGQVNSYKLDEVAQIMAKKGKAKRFGLMSAGSCVGLSLGAYLGSGGNTVDVEGNEVPIDTGQYFAGTAIWALIFYGGGYLIGLAADHWEVVYFKN